METNKEYEIILKIVDQIRNKTNFVPQIGLVLGSGLNDLINQVDTILSIPYSEIDGMPISSAPGHLGKFVFGYLKNVPVIVMQGRVHYYEGYTSYEVVRPIRVMKMLGIDTLVLTNSSGAVNLDFHAGDIMMITDQIIYNVPNPLIGKNIDEFGERFVDTRGMYNEDLQEYIKESCKELNINLKKGVYLQDTGPSYETPSETKMFRSFGGDAVGMSTAIEAIAAYHMGLKICGLSCVSADACDASNDEISAESVNNLANKMTKDLSLIISLLIEKINVGK